jgi:AAA15 family ATPase/GTPase
MYKSFSIDNFRCFDHFEISNLKRINLIAGKNNVGKTALLEALFIHAGSYNPNLTLSVNANRGIDRIPLKFIQRNETPWDLIFFNFDSSKIIKFFGEGREFTNRLIRLQVIEKDDPSLLAFRTEIESKLEESAKGMEILSWPDLFLELSYKENGEKEKNYFMFPAVEKERVLFKVVPQPPPNPPQPGYYLWPSLKPNPSDIARGYAELDVKKEQKSFIKYLKIIDSRLKDIKVGFIAEVPTLFGDIGIKPLIPFPLMGEGLDRLTKYLLTIHSATNGIVCLDEIENGFHHSVIQSVWKAIGKMASSVNAQVFASTHSFECIMAAHKAFKKEKPDLFGLFRLERINGIIKPIEYDTETLEAAIEIGLEVR